MASPHSWREPNVSPAAKAPNITPMTGFSNPSSPTVPAGRWRSPPNHSAQANAVATNVAYPKPSATEGLSAGGPPSARTAIGSSIKPPAVSCHAVSDNTSAPPRHRAESTYPTDDTSIAAADAATPFTLIALPPPIMSTTPASPTTAPPICVRCGRCPASAHAISSIASGEAAMMLAATLVGSDSEATYSRTKNVVVFSNASTAERHHHTPLGRRRVRPSSTRPAGKARSAAPHSGRSAGSSERVT